MFGFSKQVKPAAMKVLYELKNANNLQDRRQKPTIFSFPHVDRINMYSYTINLSFFYK